MNPAREESKISRRSKRDYYMSILSGTAGRVMDTVLDTLGVDGTINVTIIPNVEVSEDESEYVYSHHAIIKYDGKWAADTDKISKLGSGLQALRVRNVDEESRTSKKDFQEETLGVLDASRTDLAKSGVTLNCVSQEIMDGWGETEKSGWRDAPEEWGLSGENTWTLYKESNWPVTTLEPHWGPYGL